MINLGLYSATGPTYTLGPFNELEGLGVKGIKIDSIIIIDGGYQQPLCYLLSTNRIYSSETRNTFSLGLRGQRFSRESTGIRGSETGRGRRVKVGAGPVRTDLKRFTVRKKKKKEKIRKTEIDPL